MVLDLKKVRAERHGRLVAWPSTFKLEHLETATCLLHGRTCWVEWSTLCCSKEICIVEYFALFPGDLFQVHRRLQKNLTWSQTINLESYLIPNNPEWFWFSRFMVFVVFGIACCKLPLCPPDLSWTPTAPWLRPSPRALARERWNHGRRGFVASLMWSGVSIRCFKHSFISTKGGVRLEFWMF